MREILEASVTRLFGEMVDRKVLADAEAGGWPDELWRALEENGLTQPLAPESAGGVGASWSDAYAIVHAAGHHAAPVPLAETILAGWMLAAAGLAVPDGPLTVVPAIGEDGLRFEPEHQRLSGRTSGVPWGSRAEHAAVWAQSDGPAVIALVRLDSADLETDRNMAREPRDALVFDDSPVVECGTVDTANDPVRLYGAMLRAAQMAGALSRILDETVQYATDRVQFGRPIAKFQAVQQQLSVLAEQSARADVAAEAAFRAADVGDPTFEIATAKIVAGEAASAGAAISHQVHGAIGFTYEHVLHYLTRRLWSWRAEFGADGWWAERLGRRIAGRRAEAFWPDLTTRGAGPGA